MCVMELCIIDLLAQHAVEQSKAASETTAARNLIDDHRKNESHDADAETELDDLRGTARAAHHVDARGGQ